MRTLSISMAMEVLELDLLWVRNASRLLMVEAAKREIIEIVRTGDQRPMVSGPGDVFGWYDIHELRQIIRSAEQM